ncbi:hypothetical protein TRFO_29574 [Tritrichomonas foetus]|uniref:Uncharacterized protein n=1 Tax=Tritrichomonas foetus TaxID=1144522 RepID=A0A1J4K036_9EUKA|nr:hypothetical protein TRFO_29574 [Tritrichomonas foetus]|eukprot:OHT03102.1 hypothetical protein TRFO_29574 [Tritrichomonas foetus]
MTLIENLESCESDFISIRTSFLERQPVGLGPEDMVIIQKTEGRFFPSTKYYKQTPGGFVLNSQAAFPAYFSELLQLTSKKKFKNEKIQKGFYYSFNSFSLKDVVVMVDNPGGCTSMMITNGQCEPLITTEDWYQVSLSSKLRFYRCSQALLKCLFFSCFPFKINNNNNNNNRTNPQNLQNIVSDNQNHDKSEINQINKIKINPNKKIETNPNKKIYTNPNKKIENNPNNNTETNQNTKMNFGINIYNNLKSKLENNFIVNLLKYNNNNDNQLESIVNCYYNYNSYYVYDVPLFTDQDFEYCVKFHIPTDDFEMAISIALIINCELEYILNFLRKNDERFPRIIFHIINNISLKSPFCKHLIPILENHMKKFCDDVEVAVLFFEILCYHSNIKEIHLSENHSLHMNSYFNCTLNNTLNNSCNNSINCVNNCLHCMNCMLLHANHVNMGFNCMKCLFPLINSSFWALGSCGVAFSIFNMVIGNYNDVFEYLNLAFLANNNESEYLNEHQAKLLVEFLKKQKNHKFSNQDIFLMSNPYSLKKNKIIQTLGKLISILGNSEFHDHKEKFIKNRKICDTSQKFDVYCENDEYNLTSTQEKLPKFYNNKRKTKQNQEKLENDQNYDYVEYYEEEIYERSFEITSQITTENQTENNKFDNIITIDSIMIDTNDKNNNDEDAIEDKDNNENNEKLENENAIQKESDKNENSFHQQDQNTTNNNLVYMIHEKFVHDCEATKSDLFDPGIECEPFSDPKEIHGISKEILYKLPVSRQFLDCIQKVIDDYEESGLILAQRKDISNPTLALMMALQTNDKNLTEAMVFSFSRNDKNLSSGVDKLLLLKSYIDGNTHRLDEILSIKVDSTASLSEKNALSIMEPFAIGIHRLNNTTINHI